MFHEDITAETFFNEPRLLEKYLEVLSEETQIPCATRLEAKGLLENLTDEGLEIIRLLDARESQIKLLINYLSLLIERSQDKMLIQTETIERQEKEIDLFKEENIHLKEELKLFRGSLEDLRQKHTTLEEYLKNVEKTYQTEKIEFNEAQLELQMLRGIKQTLSVFESNESQLNQWKMSENNLELKEELKALEDRLSLIRNENTLLKEDLELKQHNLAKMNQIVSEYEKLKVSYDKMCKDFETDKKNLIMEKNASEQNLELLSDKCNQLQEELKKAKNLASQRVLKKLNSVEDPTQNLNARINSDPSHEASLVLDYLGQNGNLKTDPSTVDTLENYVSDYYDGIRVSPNGDFAGIRKNGRQKPFVSYRIHTAEAKGNYLSSPIAENSPLATSDIGSFEGEGEQYSEATQPPNKRKSILEEFFLLTFQSVLLNSPYFNDLAGIDSAKFYTDVNNQNIPYFGWSKWLENKFAEIYKDTILPKRKASQAQKNSKLEKRCLNIK